MASIILFLLSGCVEVERIKQQSIVLRTPHVTDAKCVLSDKRGTAWKVKKTPGVVTVRAGNAPLNIVCEKKGYRKTIKSVEEERVNFRNYPGFLEEVSGFVQDPFSNIATKYPDEIAVWMEPLQWESEEAMREWAYDKNIYEKQQEAIRIAREEEERRLREMEIELRTKYSNRLKQQRQRLYNSKWFEWLKEDGRERQERSINDIEERITGAQEEEPREVEPINWRSQGSTRYEPEENKESKWKFWKSDWFKNSTQAWDKKPSKRYPNSRN